MIAVAQLLVGHYRAPDGERLGDVTKPGDLTGQLEDQRDLRVVEPVEDLQPIDALSWRTAGIR